jgi:rhodanese-related sulfurtransferase
MSPVKTLTQGELERFKDAVSEGRCLLLDVRENREYEAGHIPLAQSRPLSLMEEWQGGLPKDRPLILYCRAGHRSKRCAEQLGARGFSDVYSLEGGFSAWSSRPSPK